MFSQRTALLLSSLRSLSVTPENLAPNCLISNYSQHTLCSPATPNSLLFFFPPGAIGSLGHKPQKLFLANLRREGLHRGKWSSLQHLRKEQKANCQKGQKLGTAEDLENRNNWATSSSSSCRWTSSSHCLPCLRLKCPHSTFHLKENRHPY